jgi:sensor histidine kinase YesM
MPKLKNRFYTFMHSHLQVLGAIFILLGLRNIRGRLKAMVDGDPILESKPGVGTNAVIMIPKEVIL